MDYREYAEVLKKEGLLIEIDEPVSWNLEATCITAMTHRVENGQTAHIFNNIKGLEGKGRLFGGLFASPKRRPWERANLVFGLPKETSWPDLRDEIIRRMQHPLEPVIGDAEGAPCKQNVMIGEEVNLFKFPWPFIHQSDGGRYGTFQTHVIEDPDTGWVNWGLYRLMIVSKNRMTALQVPMQHGPSIFYRKYEARNTPAPFCYFVGGDPIINFVGGTPVPAGVCEAIYAGGFRQEPLQLVKAETNNLYIPANAEIVIEGVMMPNERLDEGPLGEYTGYVHGRAPMPVFHVQCVTFRDRPIIPYAIGGCTFGDEQSLSQTMSAVEVYRVLKEAGFPIRDLRFLSECLWDGIVISTEVPYEGYIQELRAWLESHKITLWGQKAIFVDADIDISREDAMERIYQEMSTKVDPARDILITDADVFCTPLNPTMGGNARKTGVGASRQAWDCTTPYSWSEEERIPAVTIEDLFSSDAMKQAKESYTHLISE